MNRLFIGDNNQIMNYLDYKKNKYDIIYFDPPYGMQKFNDVMYKDNLNKKDWENFIKIRLEKSKNLLSKDGILFISINDIHLLTLIKLCEKIFENFDIKKLKWKKFLYTKRKIQYINPNYEYILVISINQLDSYEYINSNSYYDKLLFNFYYDESLIHEVGINKYFSYPKPAELFFNLVKLYCNKKTLKVLDAFAGSGSSIFGFELAKVTELIENYEIDFIQKNEIMKNDYKNSIDTLKKTLNIFKGNEKWKKKYMEKIQKQKHL